MFLRLALSSLLVLLVGVVGLDADGDQEQIPPHILFILVDDLGWGDVGWHNPGNPEVKTPVMDQLALVEGVILERHYVHKTCQGTRSAAQSGRLPVHVQTGESLPEYPYSGMPYNMTGIAQHMKDAGYATHFVGKWDAGMATTRHTPAGRGYDTSLNYFEHENDYWTQECTFSACCSRYWDNPLIVTWDDDNFKTQDELSNLTVQFSADLKDLWDTDKPAKHLNGTDYEEFIFRDRMLQIIETHNDTEGPMFLYYAPHVAHCPLQVPPEYLDKFDFIENDSDKCVDSLYDMPHDPNSTLQNETLSCRKQYRSMVNLLDDIVGELVDALKAGGYWDNTLLVLTSDNGGPTDIYETGATNFDLRGGKNSDWEGGIRAAAFLSGGYLPERLHGTNLTEPIHIADWYATLPSLAGVVVTSDHDDDPKLPHIDAINVWPYIMGDFEHSPRQEIPVSDYTLIDGDYKLIWGEELSNAGWSGPNWPNATSKQSDVFGATYNCTEGCLFNVREDRSEVYDLADEQPIRVQAMKLRLFELRDFYFSNGENITMSCPDGIDMFCPCWMAIHRYGGFLGPYAGLADNGTEYWSVFEES